MRADSDQQGIEGQHCTEADRQVEIAIFKEFEISDETGIGRIAAHPAKGTHARAERLEGHGADLALSLPSVKGLPCPAIRTKVHATNQTRDRIV